MDNFDDKQKSAVELMKRLEEQYPTEVGKDRAYFTFVGACLKAHRNDSKADWESRSVRLLDQVSRNKLPPCICICARNRNTKAQSSANVLFDGFARH